MIDISIHSSIDLEAYSSFAKKLNRLERIAAKARAKSDDATPKPITIEITSEGGTALDALAFASRIRRSPLDITIIAVGLVASAAVIILAAGRKRKMCQNAWLMVHEDSGKLKGNVVHVEKQVQHWRRMEDQWVALLEEFTGTDRDVWSRLHKEEVYLSSAQCLSLGIIDEVV